MKSSSGSSSRERAWSGQEDGQDRDEPELVDGRRVSSRASGLGMQVAIRLSRVRMACKAGLSLAGAGSGQRAGKRCRDGLDFEPVGQERGGAAVLAPRDQVEAAGEDLAEAGRGRRRRPYGYEVARNRGRLAQEDGMDRTHDASWGQEERPASSPILFEQTGLPTDNSFWAAVEKAPARGAGGR